MAAYLFYRPARDPSVKSFTVPQSRAHFRDSREVNEAAKGSGASPMETVNQSGEGGGVPAGIATALGASFSSLELRNILS